MEPSCREWVHSCKHTPRGCHSHSSILQQPHYPRPAQLILSPPQDVINYLRTVSHSTTYAASISAPVAQQILSSMTIIMGEDGTKEGQYVLSSWSCGNSLQH